MQSVISISIELSNSIETNHNSKWTRKRIGIATFEGGSTGVCDSIRREEVEGTWLSWRYIRAFGADANYCGCGKCHFQLLSTRATNVIVECHRAKIHVCDVQWTDDKTRMLRDRDAAKCTKSTTEMCIQFSVSSWVTMKFAAYSLIHGIELAFLIRCLPYWDRNSKNKLQFKHTNTRPLLTFGIDYPDRS